MQNPPLIPGQKYWVHITEQAIKKMPSLESASSTIGPIYSREFDYGYTEEQIDKIAQLLDQKYKEIETGLEEIFKGESDHWYEQFEESVGGSFSIMLLDYIAHTKNLHHLVTFEIPTNH